MRVSLSLILVLFCFRFQCLRAAIPTDGTANIVLIVTDDTGLDAFSGYHVGFDSYNHYANTSNIDGIGTQGVRFHKAWSHPMCSPARASIYTGRHGFRHGITHPVLIPLSPTEETVAELISPTYVSGYFGKWHLGSTTGTLPTDQGFNYFSGSLGNLEDYFSWSKTQVASENGAATTTTETNYATTTNTNEALSWINQQTQVWFAVIAYNAGHSPFHVPPADLYSGISLSGAPGTTCTVSSADSQTDCFRAMVEAMDTSIGTLLQGLPSGDTLVIVVGDNGTPGNCVVPQTGYPYSSTHAKTTVYEGGVNVPLVMKYIGADAVTGLEVLSENVYALDIFSTILEVAGITEPAGVDIDSSSLLAFVDSTRDAPEGRLTIFTELKNELGIDRWAIKTTARNGKVYKYIDNEGTKECYSLTDDDAELVNIYTQGAGPCNRLRNARSNFQLNSISVSELNILDLAIIETFSSTETRYTNPSGSSSRKDSLITDSSSPVSDLNPSSDMNPSGAISTKFGFTVLIAVTMGILWV